MEDFTDDIIDLTLGQKIVFLRKKKGFHKRQLFVDAIKDVSYTYIWEIENGTKTSIPDEILEKIAEVLEVSPAVLKSAKS